MNGMQGSESNLWTPRKNVSERVFLLADGVEPDVSEAKKMIEEYSSWPIGASCPESANLSN